MADASITRAIRARDAIRSGSTPTTMTSTLTFTASAVAQTVDFKFRDNNNAPLLLHGYGWLKVECTTATTNCDDVSITYTPIVEKADATWAVSQATAISVLTNTDYTAEPINSIDLALNCVVKRADATQYFGFDGFRLTVTPAAACTGVFALTVELR